MRHHHSEPIQRLTVRAELDEDTDPDAWLYVMSDDEFEQLIADLQPDDTEHLADVIPLFGYWDHKSLNAHQQRKRAA